MIDGHVSPPTHPIPKTAVSAAKDPTMTRTKICFLVQVFLLRADTEASLPSRPMGAYLWRSGPRSPRRRRYRAFIQAAARVPVLV